MYVNKLVAAVPKVVFACLVVGPYRVRDGGEIREGEEAAALYGDSPEELEEQFPLFDEEEALAIGAGSGRGVMYDALVLQLGSFFRYSLYSPLNMPLRKQGERLTTCRLC